MLQLKSDFITSIYRIGYHVNKIQSHGEIYAFQLK